MNKVTQYENIDLKVLKRWIDYCDNIRYKMNQMDLVEASVGQMSGILLCIYARKKNRAK